MNVDTEYRNQLWSIQVWRVVDAALHMRARFRCRVTQCFGCTGTGTRVASLMSGTSDVLTLGFTTGGPLQRALWRS